MKAAATPSQLKDKGNSASLTNDKSYIKRKAQKLLKLEKTYIIATLTVFQGR